MAADHPTLLLAIETSCDETSVAVLDGGHVRSNMISSQMVHAGFGGVVPELASRAHLRLISRVAGQALSEAGVGRSDIEGVAATGGPGLAGSLLVGLTYGKALAFGQGIPFVAVNHLEGHVYSTSIGSGNPEHPFLCLVVSGGHTMLVLVHDLFRYEVLGETRDDAAGEAFDKAAKMLGLGYPGGPAIDRVARDGDPAAIMFPRSFLDDGSFEFSFSGLKTSLLYFLRDRGLLEPEDRDAGIDRSLVADIAASFQEAVIEVLVAKTLAAAEQYNVRRVSIAGGVSANSLLRSRMNREASLRGLHVSFPPAEYCMDNAAMIGYAGWLRLARGEHSGLDAGVHPGETL